MEQGRDKNPSRHEIRHSVDTRDFTSPGPNLGSYVTTTPTSGTSRNTWGDVTSMTKNVTLNSSNSSNSQPSSGARPKTLSLASHASGARPKTSHPALNSTGARPKTSSPRSSTSGARPKKSRKSIPPVDTSSPPSPEQSQADDDSISSLLQTLNDLSPLEQESLSLSPTRSTPPKERSLSRQLSYSQQRQLLDEVQIPKEFSQSSTVRAVQIHLRDELPELATEENQKLLKTAIRAFLYRTEQLPKASDLLEDIIDSDFQEQNIVKNFAEWGLKQFGGVENFPVYRGPVESSRATNANNEHSSNQRNDRIRTVTPSDNPREPLQSGSFKTQEANVSEDNFTPNSRRDTDLTSNTKIPDLESGKENNKNRVSRKPSLKARKENQSQVVRKASLKKTSQKSLKDRLREALQTEREFLRRRLMCSQCGGHEAEVTFLPCTHLVTCSKCAPGCKTCPACGAKVFAEAKTFLM